MTITEKLQDEDHQTSYGTDDIGAWYWRTDDNPNGWVRLDEYDLAPQILLLCTDAIAALTAERDARPSPLTLRAEMARHGLLPHQTAPYVTSDRGTVDPIKDDPGNVRHFVGWLSQFAPVPEGPTDVEDFYAEAKREDSPWTG